MIACCAGASATVALAPRADVAQRWFEVTRLFRVADIDLDRKQSLGFVTDWNRRYNFPCASVDRGNGIVELVADPHKAAVWIDRYPVRISANVDLRKLLQLGDGEDIDCFTSHASDVKLSFIGRQRETVRESVIRRYLGAGWQLRQLDLGELSFPV